MGGCCGAPGPPGAAGGLVDHQEAADPAWADFAEPGYDVHTGADLLELFRWLQRPAVLRTLRAHSDPWGAAFAATDPDALERELGLPWHWVKDGERFVPSWRDHRGGRADHVFWRAVGAKGGIGGPFLLLHTGCEALSPPRSDLPYDDPEYGKFGHAESILFFTEWHLALTVLGLGALLVCADIAVRLLPTDTELKLGVAAALIGGPVFALIAARLASRGGGT